VKLLWAVGTLPNSGGSWVKAAKIGTASVIIPILKIVLKVSRLSQLMKLGI